MADRWAGSCAMAAAEPVDNAPLENFQHVAFRCAIGENETMFGRISLARDYFKGLDELEKLNPGSDKHFSTNKKNAVTVSTTRRGRRGLLHTPALRVPTIFIGPLSRNTIGIEIGFTGWRLTKLPPRCL